LTAASQSARSVFVNQFGPDVCGQKGGCVSKQFKGRSEDAAVPFLDAKFWAPGVSVTGKVVRTFESENGRCYVLDLKDAVRVSDTITEQASIGNLTGFRMALQAAGLDSLLVEDAVYIECTGKTSTNKGSPRVDFEIEVTRE
jgi:hypothetical protein